jgi:hypothetical protein
MAKYLLSVHSVEGEVGDPMTDEEMQQSWKQIQVLNEEMRSAGAWVFGGALHEPDTATVVRISDGELMTTDGPFAETKVRKQHWRRESAPTIDLSRVLVPSSSLVAEPHLVVRPRDSTDEAERPTLRRHAEILSGGGGVVRTDEHVAGVGG